MKMSNYFETTKKAFWTNGKSCVNNNNNNISVGEP